MTMTMLVWAAARARDGRPRAVATRPRRASSSVQRVTAAPKLTMRKGRSRNLAGQGGRRAAGDQRCQVHAGGAKPLGVRAGCDPGRAATRSAGAGIAAPAALRGRPRPPLRPRPSGPAGPGPRQRPRPVGRRGVPRLTARPALIVLEQSEPCCSSASPCRSCALPTTFRRRPSPRRRRAGEAGAGIRLRRGAARAAPARRRRPERRRASRSIWWICDVGLPQRAEHAGRRRDRVGQLRRVPDRAAAGRPAHARRGRAPRSAPRRSAASPARAGRTRDSAAPSGTAGASARPSRPGRAAPNRSPCWPSPGGRRRSHSRTSSAAAARPPRSRSPPTHTPPSADRRTPGSGRRTRRRSGPPSATPCAPRTARRGKAARSRG